MANQVKFEKDAREKLIEGVNLAGNSVRPTLGAKGRNIIIQQVQGGSLITNDGVTVLRHLDPKDNEMNMGVNLVREGAAKSEEIAGDGTTTVSILIQAMVNSGVKYITAGASPIDLQRGMKKASEKILKLVDENSIKISKDDEKLRQVATISANNDETLGKLVSDLFRKIGSDGVVDIQDSNNNETRIEVVEGAEYNRGYVTRYCANNKTLDKCTLNNPYVLVTDNMINSIRDILPIIDAVNKLGNAPMLIVSDEIDDDVLQTINLNLSQKRFNICFIKAPELGDARIDSLRDIAAITGATYISAGKKMELGEYVTVDMLGRCDKTITDSTTTKIVGGYGDEKAINGIIDGIKQKIENEPDDYTRSKLEQRLARLIGGVSVLYVGAPTETELEEKKMRLDDALQATRAALSYGIVPGGGVLLASFQNKLDKIKTSSSDEKFGIKVVQESLKEPFIQIMKNAGLQGEVLLEKIMSKPVNEGYDVKRGQFCDMVEAGIVDPAMVTKAAIENSVSIASMILTTAVLISEIKDENEF
jgi:chaperonin GroEL